MNRKSFQQVKLNIIIENESRIWIAERKYKLKQIRENEGKYPEMEKRLAQWLRNTRKWGVPVETWIVADEGKDILHKLYPLLFPATSELSDYPLKFSNNWQKGFFKRNKFSLRKYQRGRTSPQIRRSGLKSQFFSPRDQNISDIQYQWSIMGSCTM